MAARRARGSRRGRACGLARRAAYRGLANADRAEWQPRRGECGEWCDRKTCVCLRVMSFCFGPWAEPTLRNDTAEPAAAGAVPAGIASFAIVVGQGGPLGAAE